MMGKEIKSKPTVFDTHLEAQKARNELLKWKLIIVAAIGSAGLGFFQNNGSTKLYLIIILIPIASVYVDVLCRNLSIRSLKITRFAGTYPHNFENDFDVEYHKFYQLERDKDNYFISLETIALIGSTILFIVITTVVGVLIAEERRIKDLFIFSGILCLVFSFLVQWKYEKEKKSIKKYSNSLENENPWTTTKTD